MGELAGASAALRAACARALAEEPALAGVAVHAAAPAGVRPPYLVVGPDMATRRAWAGGAGSEHRLVISLWLTDGAAIAELGAAVERAVERVGGPSCGFRVVSAQVTRATARAAPTGWTQGVTDVRAFVEEIGDGC